MKPSPVKLLTSLFIAFGLTSCVTVTKKLDETETQAVLNGTSGGLIVAVDSLRGVRCDVGNIIFKNLDTDGTISAGFASTFGMLQNATNIIPAQPGSYVPISGNCIHMKDDGKFRTTKEYNFQIRTSALQKPAIVELGMVTNPGSYNFMGNENSLAFRYSQDVNELTAKVKKKYPNLTIIPNPQ